MGIGDDIAAALLTVAQTVLGSDKDVSLCVDVFPEVDPAVGRRGQPVPTTLASFGQAVEIRNISEQKAVALTGSYSAGDLEIKIPGAAVDESDLRTAKAYLTYGTDHYDVVRIDPSDIAFGVVTEWRVVARLRARSAST